MFKYSTSIVAFGVALMCAQAAVAQNASPMPAPIPGHAAAMAATAPRDPALKPVFDDFGGKTGLVSLMNDFMDNLMADPRTHPYFADVNRTHIKKMLVQQFCVILDGPCTYTGDDMTSVHAGMGVDRADFNALVEDLQDAMDKHHVPFRSQNKLLAKLAAMHNMIITK